MALVILVWVTLTNRNTGLILLDKVFLERLSEMNGLLISINVFRGGANKRIMPLLRGLREVSVCLRVILSFPSNPEIPRRRFLVFVRRLLDSSRYVSTISQTADQGIAMGKLLDLLHFAW
jgi:hypothetical protein